MSPPREQRIERVCVALDAASSGRDALDAAAALAAALDAELAGFFLEDVNVLRAAALSFTRELGAVSGVSRPMALEEVERALRVQAQGAQSSLAQVAQGLQLRWSFTTLRGAGMTPMLAIADEVSLTVMAARAAFPDPRALSGRPARVESPLGQGAVAALYDGSEAALNAVVLAALLAKSRRAPLAVILRAGGNRAAEVLRDRVETARTGDTPLARYVVLAEATPESTAAAARGQSAALLIVGSGACTGPQALSELLARLDCPLVVVR